MRHLGLSLIRCAQNPYVQGNSDIGTVSHKDEVCRNQGLPKIDSKTPNVSGDVEQSSLTAFSRTHFCICSLQNWDTLTFCSISPPVSVTFPQQCKEININHLIIQALTIFKSENYQDTLLIFLFCFNFPLCIRIQIPVTPWLLVLEIQCAQKDLTVLLEHRLLD